MKQITEKKPKNWFKILIVFVFCILSTGLIIFNSMPDLRERLATMELFTLVFCPLIIFYLRNNWPAIQWMLHSVLILLICTLTYSLLHEASHVAGLYLIGLKPIEVHLIPEFWKGEFTKAWIRSGPVDNWLSIFPGMSPYIKDICFLMIGFILFKKQQINSSFLAGLIYVFFCLCPLFDIINNYLIKLMIGKLEGNDFYGVTLGWGDAWSHIFGITFSIFAIAISIWIPIFYKDFPQAIKVKK